MSPSSPLPPKLYFRIGEVAGLVGVEPHVLRYWEREFRSIRPTKSAKGQRVYSRRDVENLMRVRELLYAEGFTIAGAKKKLQRSGSEPAAPLEASELAEKRDAHEADGPRGFLLEARPSREALPALPSLPSAPSREPLHDGRMREALSALRVEIEAFLAEIGG